MSSYEIKLKINDENELYNRFDENQNTLSEDVIIYLKNNLYKRETLDNITVKIKCPQDVDTEKFEKVCKQYVNDRIQKNVKNKKINKIQQVRLIIIGLLFISFSIAIGKILHTIFYTVISAVGSFAIWEASNIWLIENMESNMENKLLNNLLNIKVELERE